MIINQHEVNEFVKTLGVKPNKDLGQNFLIDSEIAKRIVEAAGITKDDSVLEIGGGLGSITHFLSEKTDKLDVVDIDERMCGILENIYKEKNVNIINKDIRKVDVSPYTIIVGNLPYYITTELVTFLLNNAKNSKKMVLMVQSEASERFLAEKGENYSAISVLIRLLGNSKKLFTVKAGCFYPIPKCTSTVFEINLINNDCFEESQAIYKMSKCLFLNRRKTIQNNLSNYLGNKEKSSLILKEIGLEGNLRPEQISPEIYRKIYKLIKH